MTTPDNRDNGHLFSFFKAPIRNTTPYKNITLQDAYNYITTPYAREATEKLRSIREPLVARRFKAENFHYATFAGAFTSRNKNFLIKMSNYMCLDFDHIENIENLKAWLTNDATLNTKLAFTSPSGSGLKIVIEIDFSKADYLSYFKALTQYILQTYAVLIDQSGCDIARACFLPYDPDAFLNL